MINKVNKEIKKKKKTILFSKKDISQIKNLGLSPRDVEKQITIFCRGPKYFKLNRACTISDGILSIKKAEKENLINLYEKESGKFKLLKFVPASGAASRMFAQWFSDLEDGGFESTGGNQTFFSNFKRYPFYSLIKQNKHARNLINQKNINGLLNYVLSSDGLNFGWLPKALIPFHYYNTSLMRTALEEHLFEAAQYVRNRGDICYLHFTVSEEHKKLVTEKIKQIKEKYKELCGVKYRLSLSIQSQKTNMLAVDKNNIPMRDENESLVFRPGGHGSLLKNIENLNADFIFVKNIDNIAPEKHLRKIIPYKKMLGGLAYQIQQEVFSIIHKMEKSEIDNTQKEEIVDFCFKKLNIVIPDDFSIQSKKKQNKIIFDLLNRPLRVCAMVKNQGEPGGGPFWVEEDNKGQQTMQIVEKGHIDQKNKQQIDIWNSAQYFNPVDMVCCIKNYRGEKFNLDKYVNKSAYLITMKNEKGRMIKALESPGLWNGAMAYWNTIFVELPLFVFNPVKTVDDLLRPEHQTGRKKN